jgi:hypothetical protein
VTPGNNPAPAPIILTQEQFDQRYGEKLTALEKELGLEPGAFKDPASLKERLGQKKPPAPTPSSDPLSGAELRLAKMEALMLAKVPSERIPGLLSRVQGKSKAEIEADIHQMITDGFLKIEAPAAQPQQQGPPNAAQGAGNNGVPGQPPTKKIWTEKEIKELRLSGKLTDELMAEIKQAAEEGRIQ